MFLVDSQKVAADSRHGSVSNMKLRVRPDGQLLELPLGKITIGSGPRCNLRIERPGVEPLHCLIVHGAEGLRVRRWATETRLNGATFDDAPLAAGDCLELGGVELDLVDPLAAALDSLAELMPLLEVEKPVGLLPYYAVVEAVDEVGALDAVAEEPVASVEVETAACEEAEPAVMRGDACEDSVCQDIVCEDSVVEVLSRERETIAWDEVEQSVSAQVAAEEAEAETAADPADTDADVKDSCAREADCSSILTEWDVIGKSATECFDESTAIAEEAAAAGESTVCEEGAERDVAVDKVETSAEECCAVEEPTEIDAVEDAGDDIGVESVGYTEEVAQVEEEPRDDRTTMNSADAVEVVFQELQAACSVARGRNRKMLAALRGLRAEKENLELRIAGANRQEPGLAEKMDAWEADRELARIEQRELHTELQEVRRQLGEWEARFAEHLDQMIALQELETARTYTPAVVVPQMAAESSQAVESVTQAAAETERAAEEPSVVSSVNALFEQMERPTEAVLEVPVVDSTESPVAEVASANDVDVVPADVRAAIEELMHDSIAEPKTTEAEIAQVATADPWEVPAEPKADWSVPAAAEANDFGAVPRAWGEVPQASVSSESELSSLGSLGSANDVVQPAWERGEEGGNDEASDDVSPFAEFSIWKQGAPAEATDNAGADQIVPEQPKADEVAAWGAHAFGSDEGASEPDAIESGDLVAPEVDANPWAKKAAESVDAVADEPVGVPAQPASFIDRYSHLFAEEEKPGAAVAAEKPVISPMAVEKPQPVTAMRSESKPAAVSAGGDDEESIEQYMAKLLQRVRGDAAPSIASQVTGIRTSVNPSTTANEVKPPKVETPVSSEAATTDGRQLTAEEQAAEVAVNWEAFTKRAATAPATNLGALRALANETARRDISRHELRTFKRNAVTKVIVSMLAGMTSLWLMLNSPNWLDIQFITACVALIVAAYWAGEACRAMLTSMRAAASHGPRTRVAEEAALPIDVEVKVESDAVDSATN